jgi:hypothetical protein
MAKKEIALEYKDRHLSVKDLREIVGAQSFSVPEATEIIIRCRSAARTVYKAIDSYEGIKITIVAREETP